LKRQVGAVLVNALPGVMGEVIGQGFNENPLGTHPCVEEPKYGAVPGKTNGNCYRDMVRQDSFVQLASTGTRCPQCGNYLSEPAKFGPPWRCRSCDADLERYFWPERAISLCTAVHAEVAAILSCAGRSKGSTLYTTTFPCLQCTEKIAQFRDRIRRVQ
jgi:deoxycytidylate deaminase